MPTQIYLFIYLFVFLFIYLFIAQRMKHNYEVN